MTGWRKRQVLEMAREVNAVFDVMAMGRHDGILFTPLELERFAELVRADEREACAKVCDDIDAEYEGEDVLATWCSRAIRARGDKHD